MSAPLLVAHRGHAKEFPENSLPALESALGVGACFIEFDVQLTADLVPVLLHDADLRRTGDRPERVMELTLRQLQAVEVNQRQVFGDRFVGIRIPRLVEAVELLTDWPRAQAFVEVKPESIEHFGVERVLEQISADLDKAPSQLIVISSVHDFVSAARAIRRNEIGVVLREWSPAVRRKLEEMRPDYVFCNLKRIPERAMLWEGVWKWVVYEVVDPSLAVELAGRGADLVETMAIGTMLADPVLGRRSCRE